MTRLNKALNRKMIALMHVEEWCGNTMTFSQIVVAAFDEDCIWQKNQSYTASVAAASGSGSTKRSADGENKRQKNSNGPLTCSPALLGELKERLTKSQSAGSIRPSTLAWSSPILFAKNPNSGKLRLCVNYRALNAVTKTDRHSIPLIHESSTSQRRTSSNFFTK